MEEAILSYAAKAKNNPDYNIYEDLREFNPNIRKQMECGEYFVRRTSKTDFKIFEDTFGYKLPSDIGDLINLFWHPFIYGFYKYDKIHERITLFSCHRHKTETDDDILRQKNGIIDLGIDWRDHFGGDITQYLPIGWISYSGLAILYELSTGRIFCEDLDNEGEPEKEPIANSLKELITGLSFTIDKLK
ncbi:MAG: hypothetical protein K2H07_06275 [Lachnospiraceae bacterium]|nr:hypothetical protein [Lachnospiraceae bacterium]